MEGYEFSAVPQWLHSDILLRVDQIHLEIHHVQSDPKYFDMKEMIELLAVFKHAYEFHIIHYEPNLSIERSANMSHQYYTNFDIVLYKQP